MTRPVKQSPISRKPALVRLLCIAALFSIILLAIQSSFFTGSWNAVNISREEIRILSDFQSNLQQCVANRGLGLTAHIIDHCNVILKFPEGTNSTWYNEQFKIFEPLEYKYDVCEAILLWEQYRNMTTVLTREYLDSRPDGWFDYAAKRIAQLGADKCYNQTLCEEHLNLILPAKPPFHPRQFRKCAVVGNSGDLLKTQFGEEIDSHDAVIRDNEAPVNEKYAKHVGLKRDFRLVVRGAARNMIKILNGSDDEVLIIKSVIHRDFNAMIKIIIKKMVPEKQAEEAIVSAVQNETEANDRQEEMAINSNLSFKSFLWHGGSVYDAWFSCASNQVAQVLLTLPYSFSQMGMLSGILLQIFYGIMGSWTAYLISVLYVEYRSRKEKENVSFKNHVIQWFEVLDGLLGPKWKAIGLAFNCTFLLFGSVIQLIACASNIYYINDHLDKRTWTYIFGACCATTVFIPSFHNYRIWSFLGLGMTTYTAWYLTIAAFIHGQVEGVIHSGPTKMVLYFTGATNILYTFGGHAVTVEIMHAMWKPQKFKYIYLYATLYVFTLTLPSAAAVYWAFGDQLLDHANAFSLLPRNGFRDTAVILMLIHQFITFGFACTPLYFVWEKVVGMHDTNSTCLRALARLPVVIPIWFLAIIFPFFGPINSAVGALLVSFTVYIIPAAAHMLTYRKASARQNAAEKPPFFLPSWTAVYAVNVFVVAWVFVVGFGFGGWASMTNFIKQVDTFGLFAKCYQCHPPVPK